MKAFLRLIINIIFSLLSDKFDKSAKNKNTSNEKDTQKTPDKSDVEEFYTHLKELYLEHGATWEDLNIFGIRNISSMNKDVFNDYIGVATEGKTYLFKATCDPGVYWTKKGGAGSGQKGVAHICLGYHKNVYMVGTHKTYEALVQYGNKIKIWRDGNNNFKKDSSDRIESGYFGTNIHRASAYKVVNKIGKYSAGCQVIQDSEDFAQFLNLVKNSKKFKKKGRNAKFSYFLFNKNEIPEKYYS